jgi:two-component system phosphate regulon sensor histidine kinase PhoR
LSRDVEPNRSTLNQEGAGVNAGKVASLIVLLMLTGMAVLVWAGAEWIPALQQMPQAPRAAVCIGVLTLLFAGILVPVGATLDRWTVTLRGYMEGAASTADGPGGNRGAYHGPKWLRPVLRSFTGAVDQFRQREQSLRNQVRDLEIRHRVSEAERRQIEAVLHALRDPVMVTDAFNEVVMANEAAAWALGFALPAGLHQPVEAIVADGRIGRMIDDVRAAGNCAERRQVELELAVKGAPGAEPVKKVFQVTLSCVEDHKKGVGGVVTILHDLTREREVSQMKSDFVSKASHELRTPLSSVRAYVEMLVDGEASDEAARREFYRIIQSETHRLGRLIDNMLNISRIEAGIVQIDRENVDMKGLIARAIETMEPQAREKAITVHARPAPVDLCVEGDSDMLYQVILNLVSNAVKYTPEGGRVTIAADSDNLTRSVLVTVADTGLGIPPDALPRLFDKFFRVENYKRVAKGTGLGLSLCKHIVETVHRGQIGVETTLGMGSRFWFTIPMRYAGGDAAPLRPAPAEMPRALAAPAAHAQAGD